MKWALAAHVRIWVMHNFFFKSNLIHQRNNGLWLQKELYKFELNTPRTVDVEIGKMADKGECARVSGSICARDESPGDEHSHRRETTSMM
jgi:hypothetical protein